MSPTPIKEYSKNALINIAKHLEFSNYEREPVTKTITFQDYNDIFLHLNTILSSIETIGFFGQKEDMGLCGGLAQLAQKLLPLNELDFLDSLLIKKEDSKEDFEKIKNL